MNNNQNYNLKMLVLLMDSLFSLCVFLTPVILVGILNKPNEWFLVWSFFVLKYIRDF